MEEQAPEANSWKNASLKEACEYVVGYKQREIKGDMGIIAVSRDGDFEMHFNTERMHRGWRTSNDASARVAIYK